MKKRFWISITVTFALVSLGLGFKAGADYATYRHSQGSFHIFYRLFIDSKTRGEDGQLFKIYAWGALEEIRQASWMSRRAYWTFNPLYSMDPETGTLTPNWSAKRPTIDPIAGQLEILQSLYEHEFAQSIPTVDDLEATVIQNHLASKYHTKNQSRGPNKPIHSSPDRSESE